MARMLTWREADVARRTRTDATRHARPRGRAYEAHAARRWRGWRGHVTGIHAGPRKCPCGVPSGRGVGSWRTHGLVGPGNMIGAVTQ